MSLSFEKLIAKSTTFQREICNIPTNANRLSEFQHEKNEIEQMAAGVRIVLNQRVGQVIDRFLQERRRVGSTQEQLLYSTIDRSSFIKRLISKRPLVFMGPSDFTVLRNGVSMKHGNKEWEKVGAGDSKINFQEYLSYKEMRISALLGVSVPTFFINDGGKALCECAPPILNLI